MRQIRQILEKLTGYKIVKQMPLGVDEFADVKTKFPSYTFRTMFDVGANIGQTALHMSKHFPLAEIHSFEPIAHTFATMVKNTKGLNINTYPLALGSENTEIEVTVQKSGKDSVLNSLVAENSAPKHAGSKTEIVKVNTLQSFCETHKIKGIDFLKIDTEGFDLEVLKGGSAMLEKQEIPFVMAEVSMNPTNTFHVAFEEIKKYMEAREYYLFGMYDQAHEWKTKTPILRRSNVLFVSGKLAFGKK